MDNENLENIVTQLVEASKPERIILFGSRARQQATAESDLDLMVVVDDRAPADRKEAARLRRVVSPFLMNIDLVLVKKAKYDYWKDTISTVFYAAEQEGRILYEKAA